MTDSHFFKLYTSSHICIWRELQIKLLTKVNLSIKPIIKDVEPFELKSAYVPNWFKEGALINDRIEFSLFQLRFRFQVEVESFRIRF